MLNGRKKQKNRQQGNQGHEQSVLSTEASHHPAHLRPGEGQADLIMVTLGRSTPADGALAGEAGDDEGGVKMNSYLLASLQLLVGEHTQATDAEIKGFRLIGNEAQRLALVITGIEADRKFLQQPLVMAAEIIARLLMLP